MPPLPSLTESWAGTYLQVVATILVFVFGLPFLIEQISLSEDLKLVLRRHRRPLAWVALLLLLSALVMLSFVWWLHPVASPDSSTASETWANDLIAASMMTLIILATFATLYLRRWYQREGILRFLAMRCSRHLRRKGTLDERALADIAYLGEKGDAGPAKGYALDALDLLSTQVQGRTQYSGDGLTDILLAVESTLRGGDARNFKQGTAILEHLVWRLQDRSELSISPDMDAAFRVSSRIGVLALQRGFEQAALGLLGVTAAVAVSASDAFSSVMRLLFDLGTAALREKRYGVGAATLNRMEQLVQLAVPVTPEVTADYLGLVAGFWVAGESARDRARLSLQLTGLESSLKQLLPVARAYHVELARFDTADKLSVMQAEISKPTRSLGQRLLSFLVSGQRRKS